jgi:hypothetical protein
MRKCDWEMRIKVVGPLKIFFYGFLLFYGSFV